MDARTRHRRIWPLLQRLLGGWLRRKFNFTACPCPVAGPLLVIPNHVTNWDPLLVALSFPDTQLDFVASEHIFRWGLRSKLIGALVGVIARRKGASGANTVMACIRSIRAGGSVCLFAEGDACWNGRSAEVFPATGKLAKACGATLVTYRLEGGHLSAPRWGLGVRRGKMRGVPVNIYTPEQLAGMSAEAVNAAINRDIYEDAWQRQAREQTAFSGKAPARLLETALFLCPDCGGVGSLVSEGDRLRCGCGASRRFTALGGFVPAEPFENPGQWDDWQRQALSGLSPDEEGVFFSDGDIYLTELPASGGGRRQGVGRLRQCADALEWETLRFPLSRIEGMSMHGRATLALSADGRYWELTAKKPCSLRKYLLFYQNHVHAGL